MSNIISGPNKVKARKRHMCDYCQYPINSGDTYKRSTHTFEGDIYTWKSHIHCEQIANKLKMFEECDEGLTSLNNNGEVKINKLLKTHGILKLLDAIDKSSEKYYKSDDDFELVLEKTSAILSYEKLPDHIQKILYIIGICKNKFYYINKIKMVEYLKYYYSNGNDLYIIENMVKNDSFKNYTEFINFVNDNS